MWCVGIESVDDIVWNSALDVLRVDRSFADWTSVIVCWAILMDDFGQTIPMDGIFTTNSSFVSWLDGVVDMGGYALSFFDIVGANGTLEFVQWYNVRTKWVYVRSTLSELNNGHHSS